MRHLLPILLIAIIDAGRLSCFVFPAHEMPSIPRRYHMVYCVDSTFTAAGAILNRKGEVICEIKGTVKDGVFHGTICDSTL